MCFNYLFPKLKKVLITNVAEKNKEREKYVFPFHSSSWDLKTFSSFFFFVLFIFYFSKAKHHRWVRAWKPLIFLTWSRNKSSLCALLSWSRAKVWVRVKSIEPLYWDLVWGFKNLTFYELSNICSYLVWKHSKQQWYQTKPQVAASKLPLLKYSKSKMHFSIYVINISLSWFCGLVTND